MESSNVIGNGYFGSVIKEKINNNKIRAKKTINIKKFNDKIVQTSEEVIKGINNIILKMNEIVNEKNCNITKYYDDITVEDGKISFKMEICDYNLGKYLSKNFPKKSQGLDIAQVYNILVQLNNAFSILELHNLNMEISN